MACSGRGRRSRPMLSRGHGLWIVAFAPAVCAGCGGNAATGLGGMVADASVDGTTPAQNGDGGSSAVDGGGGGGDAGGEGDSDASVDGEVITEGGSTPITDGGEEGGTLPD